tara:strand:+ start:300 stop:446 length:147 start_codon:yes stop_codon:yes gene_type:complete
MKEEKRGWWVELGIYPGILLGFRTYDQGSYMIHVLYFPFLELSLSINK